ncbi:DNA-processing protein DprA [Cellulomonas fimi]|uniref:SMF family protein n=1 Tax=Cellulomonas fimi (strain ATCC 484 / DSM 20113 / JCM 1341 / CCUG 24087 / LMG 16345 / NBRC 15513 / NCIMB 8980 / NCTC 7547 / NRS-133) TaxID=590998 RepID=F4H6L3_CELFA|nr:DNA-processing protein DprA [Cellulomonas fimi]AEE45646.1 SMF family protein [Cellulomonas fimi ATCC 484]NNH08060.1 DNA-processing protein DprA [Cellulomonas fimi]VEH30169.1 Transposase and inactivated derivatives [Cellulomonas fimi]
MSSAPEPHDERTARAAWSELVEPGDPVAGALVAAWGAREAWEWVRRAAVDGVRDDVPSASRSRVARAVDRWAPRLPAVDGAGRLRALEDLGGTLLVPGDGRWPRGLRDLGPAAPLALWVRGRSDLDAVTDRSVAVVGARAATTYGERLAHDVAGALVDADVAVVSGGAFGIDAAAHRGALARGGPTVVVLAGGVDRAYPVGNARMIAAVMDDGGTVVSEVPVGALPTRSRFLQRNRVIAATARASVVVEAAWRSGAISTAHHAAGLLRPVGAFPGPVTSVASAGCHRLLRDGVAVCVTDPSEVLELAGLGGARGTGEPGTRDTGAGPADGLPEHAARVLDALSRRRARDAATTAADAGVSLAEARAALGLLELAGLAERVVDGWRLGPATRATPTAPASSPGGVPGRGRPVG